MYVLFTESWNNFFFFQIFHIFNIFFQFFHIFNLDFFSRFNTMKVYM